MFFPLILNLLLYFSLVSTSFFSCCSRNNNLLIDKISYKQSLKGEYNDNFLIVYDYKQSKNSRLLRKLYEIVESGDLSLSSVTLMKMVDEIFEKNRFYCYSPVEWAILQNGDNVLKHFIEESLLKHAQPHHVGFELVKLLGFSIRTGKFEKFKYLLGKYNKSVECLDFLNLAVQHHVSEAFLDYLLEECGLAGEVDGSDNEFYESPLHTAIKFNNVAASLKFIRSKKRISPVTLQYVLLHNRTRLLTILFEEFEGEPFLFDCNFKDSENGNLLHMAAKYAIEPEMMKFILNKCPNIPIDDLNGKGKTALELCLKFSSPKKQKMAEILILNGANVFLSPSSSKGTSPLDTIIAGRLTEVFKLILEIWMKNGSKLQMMIDKIFAYRSWLILDQVLPVLSNQDPTIRFEDISLSSVIKDKAFVTLDFALAWGFLELDEEAIANIVLTGSLDMVRVALKHGANPLIIRKMSERKKFIGMLSEETYESIMTLIN